jgi:hypothetical protein
VTPLQHMHCRPLEEAQNKHWHLCRGSGLTDSCNTVHKKSAEQRRTNITASVSEVRMLTPLYSLIHCKERWVAQNKHWHLCQRIGVLTPLQHNALQRSAAIERRTNPGICARGSGADSSATQCTAGALERHQNITASSDGQC